MIVFSDQNRHGLALPDWANVSWRGGQTPFERLRRLEDLSFELRFTDPMLARLRGGGYHKDINIFVWFINHLMSSSSFVMVVVLN